MAHIEENLPQSCNNNHLVYHREVILKKEGNKRWTEYYAVLADKQLIFNKKDSRTGLIIPQNRTVLEITPKTSCAYSEKTCYRFPFYIRNEKGTYYFKCETNLQRYRWMYAVRLASAGRPPEPAPKFIPTKHVRTRTSSQRREQNPDRQNTVTGKRNLGYVKDDTAHDTGVNIADYRNSHAKDVFMESSATVSSIHLNSTGTSMHSLTNNDTASKYSTDIPAWRKENTQANGVLHSHAINPNNIVQSKRTSDTGSDWEGRSLTKHPTDNKVESSKVNSSDSYAFKIIGESRRSSTISSHADLEIEDLDEELQVGDLNNKSSILELTHHSYSIESNILKAGGTGEPYIEHFHGKDDSPLTKGIVMSDILGNSRLLIGDLYPRVKRKESRGNAITRSQGGGMQGKAAIKHGDTMKSQSWTSLNFIRSPMNTTQRREHSAPALRFSRHRDVGQESS